MKKIVLFFIAFTFFLRTATAQHEGHQMQDSTIQEMQMESSEASGDHMMMDTSQVPMSHAFSLNLPMNRNGSGTGWLPDASPMYGYMIHGKKWLYMFHGNVFLRYNNQDITNKGTRGDEEFDTPNWLMGMGQTRVGQRGLFRFSVMLSLDELTGGGDGYPLLFQSGETFEGQPLVDRQHPHDLVSELSIGYTHMISEDVDISAYLGYPGEPALGPVAFMHRPSALNNPNAGLGHHWQDATHIIFGVATLGVRYKIFKLDGSIFTGREPDENRYNFDKPRFDSYSYRLSANPSAHWAIQASQAFIQSPEALEPEEDVTRTTASVIHAYPLGRRNYNLNSAVVWGLNRHDGENEHSFLLESNLQLDRFALYGRYEWVQKSAEELQVEGFEEHQLFDVNALTIGTNYVILRALQTNLAVGLQGSIYMAESALDPIYGNNPLSGQIYLRLYPQLMRMGGMNHRNMNGMHH